MKEGMQKLIFILPHSISIGSTGVGLFGFIEVPWSSRHVMLGGHPIDPFFIKSIYIFLILLGLTIGIYLVIESISRVIKRKKNTTIDELEVLQWCGEEMVNWASARNIVNTQDVPQTQNRVRYVILRNKYRKWGIAKTTHQSVGDDVLRYANCAETIKWHGYIKGRFMLWNERRKWNKTITEQ